MISNEYLTHCTIRNVNKSELSDVEKYHWLRELNCDFSEGMTRYFGFNLFDNKWDSSSLGMEADEGESANNSAGKDFKLKTIFFFSLNLQKTYFLLAYFQAFSVNACGRMIRVDTYFVTEEWPRWDVNGLG